MSAPSFERIDYQLRYNKHIERRLIFDVLSRASSLIGLDSHRYLGFGSMWFADFRLAHKVLGVINMISMEREEHSSRAEFNKPYRTITIKAVDSSECLRGMPDEEWRTPFITWLDYDGGLEISVVRDLELLLQNCAADSIVVVTVNGNRLSYRPNRSTESPRTARTDISIGQVESLLGEGTISPRFEKGLTAAGVHIDLADTEFSECLADALLTFMRHKLNTSGRTSIAAGVEQPLCFVPLFNFTHKDGTDMVTIGGAICSAEKETTWRDTVGVKVQRDESTGYPVHLRLDLIPLTVKEKLTLDTCLPHTLEEFKASAKSIGLRLHDDELTKYWKFYPHFPVFFEAPV